MKTFKFLPVLALILCTLTPSSHAAEKLKALIIDGQNNHAWQQTTPWIKWALEQSGRFTVDVSTTPHAPEQWETWHPKFRDYAVIVSNYNGEMWPEDVRGEFVEFVRGGGGFVSVHAADNSFPQWPEYNEMIGLGGWGGRSEKDGPMVRYRDGKIVRDETPGAGGAHGAQHEFTIEARVPEHPIVKGLPAKWRHATDELYAKLRGPAKNMTVLATAFSSPQANGTGENEPILMVVDFGKGRVFHTTMGHSTNSMAGLGFQVTLARGAEWAATGKVTIPAPKPEELPDDKAALREMPK